MCIRDRVRIAKSPYQNVDVDILKVARMAGVVGLKTTMYQPGNWVAEGEIMIGENTKAIILLSGLPKPPSCRIEAYKETVTKYKAICEETGEEVK